MMIIYLFVNILSVIKIICFMRFNYTMKFVLYVSIMCFVFNSCIDKKDYEFNRLSDQIDWTPNVLVPVGLINVSLWDVLNDYDETPKNPDLYYDDDGLFHMKYSSDQVFKLDIDSLLRLPIQNDFSFTIAPPNIKPILPVTFTSTFDLFVETKPFDFVIYDMDTSGELIFQINNPLNTKCIVSQQEI